MTETPNESPPVLATDEQLGATADTLTLLNHMQTLLYPAELSDELEREEESVRNPALCAEIATIRDGDETTRDALFDAIESITRNHQFSVERVIPKPGVYEWHYKSEQNRDVFTALFAGDLKQAVTIAGGTWPGGLEVPALCTELEATAQAQLSRPQGVKNTGAEDISQHIVAGRPR